MKEEKEIMEEEEKTAGEEAEQVERLEAERLEAEEREAETAEDTSPEKTLEEKPIAPGSEELKETKDKYLRLYAEFENYKKRMLKDKDELVRYSNESLIYDLLPSLDNLDIALKHASDDESSKCIAEGVEITRRELMRTLDKFGLKTIDSLGKPFDPEFHHAMAQVVRDDVEENTVVEEMRRGYLYRDKVMRAALVSVSKKPVKTKESETNNKEEAVQAEED